MFLTLETTSGERSFCFIFFMFFSELFISLRLKTKQKKGGGEGRILKIINFSKKEKW